MTNKIGSNSVFPNTHGAERFQGLTYRQYMAAQIAGHMAANNDFTAALAEHVNDPDKALRTWGLTVWLLTDAILETEDAPPEQHAA